MVKETVKYITKGTLVGIRKYPVPANWNIDVTAEAVWVSLLYTVFERNHVRSTRMGRKVRKLEDLDLKAETLASVLANVYGMASTYYILEADRMQEYMPNG